MKKLFGCVCVCQVLLPVLLVLCTIAGLKANNIRVDGKTRVTGFVGDTAVIEVNLLWDNSWRDDFNWDAAWVFFKFKKRGLENPWQHAYLGSSGHVLSASAGNEGGGYAYMVGANGGKVNGLYVMRNSISEGNASVRVQVKWPLTGTGLTKSDFGDALDKIYIAAHAIEMVYIPYGAYYLGDGYSYGNLQNKVQGAPLLAVYDIIDNISGYEYSIKNPVVTGSVENIADRNPAAAYPNSTLYFNAVGGGWVQIDFKTPKTIRYFGVSAASNYCFGSQDCRPKGNWYLTGSNDSLTWTRLYTGVTADWWGTSVAYPVQNTLKVTNPGSYRYYRIEMSGAVRTDDGIVIQSIAMTEKDLETCVVDSEDALTLASSHTSWTGTLAASYPKGYAGFYVMKYETSQEQYVEFLNSLTLEQQKARVANNNFSTMKRSDYVFGDLHAPSCRNGIAFVEQKQSDAPVVFGNNLNPKNDFFSTDDGQTLACNYMSVEDMIAYCSWSGLRPMSELEYEKACRRFYPQLPDKGEYAWNTNNGVNRLSGLYELSYQGDQREQAVSYMKNVNSGTTNSINGPVRCGLFATSATNQTQAGATYWGVMEMSGNLKELCANVNYTTLNGGSCGTGVYNANLWDKTVNKYGVRGGGFSSADSSLRTSDRTEVMNYFTAITQRDSTVGFRGVYSLSGIKIDGGEIQASQTTICPGTDIDIDMQNLQEANCPDFPDVRFQYNWYVKKPGNAKFDLIENTGGTTLTYNVFENNTSSPVTYRFKRMGICSMGVAESNEISITVGMVPANIPSVPPSYSSIVGVPFTLPCITSGKEKANWKAPDGTKLDCSATSITALSSPQTYQTYFVNEYGCEGKPTDVIIKGYSGLSSIPKHAKEYQTLGATENGVYIIDPDGPGGNTPLPVYCNMTSEGGGWMLIVNSLANTSVSSLRTSGVYNAAYLGNINIPYKYTDAWINTIAFVAYWTEGRDGCNRISNSYWRASECKGGGKFVIASYGEYNTGASCCYRRYGNAAMTTGLHEGTTRYRRSMFDDDRGGNAYFIWPHCNVNVYVEWGHGCSNGGRRNGEYRIWVR